MNVDAVNSAALWRGFFTGILAAVATPPLIAVVADIASSDAVLSGMLESLVVFGFVALVATIAALPVTAVGALCVYWLQRRKARLNCVYAPAFGAVLALLGVPGLLGLLLGSPSPNTLGGLATEARGLAVVAAWGAVCGVIGWWAGFGFRPYADLGSAPPKHRPGRDG